MNAILLEGCAGAVKLLKCDLGFKSATNCKDVQIAQTICSAIIDVTVILVIGFLIWKLIDYIAKGCQEKRQHKWEDKDKDRKNCADKLSRAWKIEDEERKNKAAILNKKLEILHKMCYDENFQKELKNYGSQEITNYLAALEKGLGPESTTADTVSNKTE